MARTRSDQARIEWRYRIECTKRNEREPAIVNGGCFWTCHLPHCARRNGTPDCSVCSLVIPELSLQLEGKECNKSTCRIRLQTIAGLCSAKKSNVRNDARIANVTLFRVKGGACGVLLQLCMAKSESRNKRGHPEPPSREADGSPAGPLPVIRDPKTSSGQK